MPPLLVIIPDKLSDIVSKGEIAARYYNPGNLFDEVHILMISDDRVDPHKVQKTVGDARLFLHNLPLPDYKRSLGYNPWMLRSWSKPAVDLSKSIKPCMIRCYGNWMNGFVASRIKKKLGIPYIVSMHTEPDESLRERLTNHSEINYWNSMKKIEKITLKYADLVIPVYQSIIPYLVKMGISRYEVVYNVISPDNLVRKNDYHLHSPVRILSVGRHFQGKNPDNIIRAVGIMSNVHLNLVGDGPYQEHLEHLAMECNLTDNISFHRSIPNDVLCKQLPEYDIFVVHCDYLGISKTVLEASLTGLPIVINRRAGKQVPELQGDHIMLVENSPKGYSDALIKLISNDLFREQLGKRAYAYAQDHWNPEKTEARYVDLYRQILQEQGIVNI